MQIPQTELLFSTGGQPLLQQVVQPGEYIIGREAGCDLLVEAGLVSRRHAKLTVNYSEVLIEDLGSSNGTTVQGKPVTESVRLWPGQAVQIGEATLTVRRLKSADDGQSIMPWTAELRRQLPEELRREGRYTIQELVAQGGMGAILNARDQTIRRTVAMKVMLDARSGEEMVRFIEEAQVTGQLEHPNIVPIYELGVDECEQPFYTMKFVRGITLKKVLELIAEGRVETAKKYPLVALLTVFQKVCDAIAFAHSRGVIHRDLKPENIMIGDFGEVLVMDWGLAKTKGAEPAKANALAKGPLPSVIRSARTDSGDFGATMAGTIMGTPNFMAPEQAEGRIDELDGRTDIFALGGILYSILTLQIPFSGESVDEVLEKVISGLITAPAKLINRKASPVPPSSVKHLPGGRVPEALSAVAMKALATRPADRYQTVPELQRDIEAYQGGFATRAERAGTGKQIALLIKRHKTVSAAAVLLLLLSVLFTGKVFTERNRAERSLAELRGTAPVFEAQSRTSLADGNLEDALSKIGYAATLAPGHADYRLQRAHLLESTQRLPEAIADYRRVLALRPGDASAKLNLALCERLYAQQGSQPSLSPPAQSELLDSLVAQHRDLEIGPLSHLLKRDEQNNEALLRARLASYTSQAGWAPGRVRGVGHGQFGVNLGSLQLGDLHVLDGMPIAELVLTRTSITDLRPLAGLPLRVLDLNQCKIADLSPLRGMKLKELSVNQSLVTDLSPLAGMPLETLRIPGTRVADLSPLRGAPLKVIDGGSNPALTNLEPLRGMPLESLILTNTSVQDLGPLRGLPLRLLEIGFDEKIVDLAPLAGNATLERIVLPDECRADVSVLATLPKLKEVGFRQTSSGRMYPAKDFLATYGIQVPEIKAAREALASDGFPDLEIWRVSADENHLLTLKFQSMAPVNLRSLRELPIKLLKVQAAKFNDLSPLPEFKDLEEFTVEVPARNVEKLRGHPKLRFLQNGAGHTKPPTVEEFWKEYDAQHGSTGPANK